MLLPAVLEDLVLGYMTSAELYIYSLVYPACTWLHKPNRVTTQLLVNDSFAVDAAAKDALNEAASQGWVEGLQALFELPPPLTYTDTKEALLEAAEKGHIAALDFLAPKALHGFGKEREGMSVILNHVVWHAGKGGHIVAIEWCSKLAKDNECEVAWDLALCGATRGGHIEVMKWCMERGARGRSTALVAAAECGHIQAMEWLTETRTTPPYYYSVEAWNVALERAAASGQLKAMEWLAAKGAVQWNWAIDGAARSGQIEAMEWIIKRCPHHDWTRVFSRAAECQQLVAMQWLADKAANDPGAREMQNQIHSLQQTLRER